MENWVWIAVGGFLLADTFAVKWISNWNMGVLMPAILGAPLFFYGLFYQEAELWFQTEAGRIVKGIFVVGCVSFFLFFLFCIFLMERGKTRRMKEPPEAVIVLGGGLRGERPSRLLRKRLDTGKKLAEESRAILVVSGGQGRDEVISEAEAMRRYLEAQGFPRGRILIEEPSAPRSACTKIFCIPKSCWTHILTGHIGPPLLPAVFMYIGRDWWLGS